MKSTILALILICASCFQVGHSFYDHFECRFKRVGDNHQHYSEQYPNSQYHQSCIPSAPYYYYPKMREDGICSWYTAPAGTPTASGEPFNPSAMTAAHKTLPFGTNVRVSIGSQSAVVRINDRGPFVPGRILDVTPAAAAVLGFIDRGIAPCTVDPI